MSEDILVNFTPMETRVALLDNGVTQDVYIERNGVRGLVGNIYAVSYTHLTLPTICSV